MIPRRCIIHVGVFRPPRRLSCCPSGHTHTSATCTPAPQAAQSQFNWCIKLLAVRAGAKLLGVRSTLCVASYAARWMWYGTVCKTRRMAPMFTYWSGGRLVPGRRATSDDVSRLCATRLLRHATTLSGQAVAQRAAYWARETFQVLCARILLLCVPPPSKIRSLVYRVYTRHVCVV